MVQQLQAPSCQPLSCHILAADLYPTHKVAKASASQAIQAIQQILQDTLMDVSRLSASC